MVLTDFIVLSVPIEIEDLGSIVDHNSLVNGEAFNGSGNNKIVKEDTNVKDFVYLPNIVVVPVS